MTKYEEWLKANVEYNASPYSAGYEMMGDDPSKLLEKIKANSTNIRVTNYRDEGIAKFSFAILNMATVRNLLPYGPFLEIGCGLGYWAYELIQVGADVIPTDPDPYMGYNRWNGGKHKLHIPIVRMTAEEAIRTYPGRTLLTVWPSYDAPWPADALNLYTQLGGHRVVYVGEGDGGCTADERFHQILDKQWKKVADFYIPQWSGIHDRMYVYERPKNPIRRKCK